VIETLLDNGLYVAVVDYLGNVIGCGRVRSGDNYPESNASTTWVTMTLHGETRTEEWPTSCIVASALVR
jgi:hypothetical protein